MSRESRISREVHNLSEAYQNKLIEDFTKKTAWRFGSDQSHPWKDFTTSNPHHHDPQNYRYFIHAVRTFIQDPEALVNSFLSKPAASLSLVWNGNHRTFYRVGFVLDVPPSHIVAARPSDLAGGILDSDSSELDFKKAIAKANDIWGVWTPDEILQFSPLERNHNEVYAVTGFKYVSDQPKIKITGVFFDGYEYKRMSDLAQKIGSYLQLPVVTLS